MPRFPALLDHRHTMLLRAAVGEGNSAVDAYRMWRASETLDETDDTVYRILPLLLAATGGVDLATGQFGQPTTLGFAVFVAGLCLASARTEEQAKPAAMPSRKPASIALAGRSAYAERLHGTGNAAGSS